MARLFSAVVPAESTLEHLAEHVAEVRPRVPALRWTPAERWHLTLGFFGDDDDPGWRSRWLRRRTRGLPACRLRLAGSGLFGGVLWVGVEPAGETDRDRLTRLARAAGAGRRGYRPHLTVARWRAGRPDSTTLRELFGGYTGPWFTPGEVLLMRSELGTSGSTYSVVERVPLSTE